MSLRNVVAALVFVTIPCISGCDLHIVRTVLTEHGITDETAIAAAHAALTAPLEPSDEALQRLRQCESSDNYQAVSASGKYRGAYQFDRRTWASVGGAGSDPAAATPAEQDAAVRRLYAQRGRSPWPHCGKRI